MSSDIENFIEKYNVSEFTIDWDTSTQVNRIEETASNVHLTIPIDRLYSLVYQLQQQETEKNLRTSHMSLNEAYQQYQTLLKLCTP